MSARDKEIRVNKGGSFFDYVTGAVGAFMKNPTPNKLLDSDGEALIFPTLFTPPKTQDSAYVHDRFERLKVWILKFIYLNTCSER